MTNDGGIIYVKMVSHIKVVIQVMVVTQGMVDGIIRQNGVSHPYGRP